MTKSAQITLFDLFSEFLSWVDLEWPREVYLFKGLSKFDSLWPQLTSCDPRPSGWVRNIQFMLNLFAINPNKVFMKKIRKLTVNFGTAGRAWFISLYENPAVSLISIFVANTKLIPSPYWSTANTRPQLTQSTKTMNIWRFILTFEFQKILKSKRKSNFEILYLLVPEACI